MAERKFLNGNYALAAAVKLAAPEVIAAYPITPQSSIVEKLAEFVSNGELEADFIKVESEHSALAACYGAASTGCRVFTATSSQGLAYMAEMLPYVSGNRFPVVMAVANRGLAAPWTIWGDHQDAVSMRDHGWIQLHVENAQEALDTCLQAYKLAEHPGVLTPVMVCLDGFVLSHTEELVEVPTAEEVKGFLPPYEPMHAVDMNNPTTFCIGAGPDVFTEYKYSQQLGMEAALELIPEIAAEFAEKFGRNHGGLIESYSCEDAEYILVSMGSVTGTARVVADQLRSEGVKAGILKLRAFRPFPIQAVSQVIKRAKGIGVLDRDYSYGNEGALATEVKAALYGSDVRPSVTNFIAGLGGRDILPSDIREMFAVLERSVSQPGSVKPVNFVGLRWQR